MPTLPDGCVDMVMTDPPYGTTACKWDSIIPLEPMWEQLKRLIKPNGAIVMTASQPFTTTLIASNMKMFKYSLVYEKTTSSGHLNAKKMPMRSHEDILVFYVKLPTYNPQKTFGHKRKISSAVSSAKSIERSTGKDKVYQNELAGKVRGYDSTERFPRSVLLFSTDKQKSTLHPTQKPVALMEYLIKTYTNEGETVLDFTMGSGTTGVACKNLNRDFIGIEKDEKYFEIAKKRIEEANSLFNP
jgi:site-specific DNA-methyltransferase (adenine-specific)